MSNEIEVFCTKDKMQASSRRGIRAVREDKMPIGRPVDQIASVVDLFCGAGGLSHGFVLEGLPVSCGIDLDEDCRYAFESNNAAPFVRRDVSTLGGGELDAAFALGKFKVLVGCAPCQPFSLYTQGREGKGIEDPKWALLKQFARLIDEVRPDVVSMENVQRLRHFRGGVVLIEFIERLEALGYFVSEQDVPGDN
jgi:DNA (cytosine-5)-methyltransferase 1